MGQAAVCPFNGPLFVMGILSHRFCGVLHLPLPFCPEPCLPSANAYPNFHMVGAQHLLVFPKPAFPAPSPSLSGADAIFVWTKEFSVVLGSSGVHPPQIWLSAHCLTAFTSVMCPPLLPLLPQPGLSHHRHGSCPVGLLCLPLPPSIQKPERAS